MQTTELIPAFEWSCDNCGRRHYASGITLSAEEVKRLVDPVKQIDVGAMEGCWMRAPRSVQCDVCKTRFKVEEMGP